MVLEEIGVLVQVDLLQGELARGAARRSAFVELEDATPPPLNFEPARFW